MPLATRIIPVLLNKGGSLVKGRAFNHGRVVGHTLQAIRIYQGRNVDELVYLDVTATAEQRGPDIALVSQFASECFMPLTVGGGIRTLDHIRSLLAAGADKVAINTAAVETPELITEAAHKFGAQAVVVSIDVKDGKVATHCGKVLTNCQPLDWAKEVESRGAGEILLNAIDRDGTLSGYDLHLVESVSGAVGVPVIACGGAGSYEDFRLALQAGAHAVAASALWHFTDATPAGAAEYLASHGIPVRRKHAA
jgi:imidazole glycerol-phosphate synthase subunit HisF